MTASKLILKQNVWILVCDGKKALLLQNAGDHVYPNLETRLAMEHPVHRSGDLGSDTPGRVFQGSSGRRTALDDGDPHAEEELIFLRSVMAELERRITKGTLNDLIVVAPPRALGILRALENSHVKAVTRGEFAHDYVKLPVYEIEKHLRNMRT